MNTDGTGITRLTNDPAHWYIDPAFSPDGQRIVFYSNRDGNNEIYTMNADGTGITRLTNNPAGDFYPTFSPDGQRIAFVSDREGDMSIYIMNADGTGQTRITYSGPWEMYPVFSPDGKRIAIASNWDGSTGIYIMKRYDRSQFAGQMVRLTINDDGLGYSMPDWGGSGKGTTPTPKPEPDTEAPTVTRVVPAPGRTGVSPKSNVYAYFSEAMDVDTIGRSTFKLRRKGATTSVSASVRYDDSNQRAMLNPARDLRRGTAYVATVTTGARDLSGNALADRKVWRFTVRR